MRWGQSLSAAHGLAFKTVLNVVFLQHVSHSWTVEMMKPSKWIVVALFIVSCQQCALRLSSCVGPNSLRLPSTAPGAQLQNIHDTRNLMSSKWAQSGIRCTMGLGVKFSCQKHRWTAVQPRDASTYGSYHVKPVMAIPPPPLSSLDALTSCRINSVCGIGERQVAALMPQKILKPSSAFFTKLYRILYNVLKLKSRDCR